MENCIKGCTLELSQLFLITVSKEINTYKKLKILYIIATIW